MNTKVMVGIIGVLVLAGIAYFMFVPKSASSPSTSETPTPSGSEAKIDINAVCEGALAYMSFPDGASAEAFVQECKEGKHPEVIEQYKASLNLDADAAI
ncbi:hypothetical protein C4568_02515 [Candidatus Parcubacteria bacterium]|nr:MAG: hypothetical protein C4568_02515 [Candidatus Parcubacteria bacterium]